MHGEERPSPTQRLMEIMVTGGTLDWEFPSVRATDHSLCCRAASFRHLRAAVRRSSSHQGTSYQVAESLASNHEHVVGSQAVI